jgi:hypothetical protein
MKYLNRQIALVAFTSLLAIGNSMANESGLSSSNSSVGKSSYLVETDSKSCKLPNGKKGTVCKTGECVKDDNMCPKKHKSPHYKETTLDNEGI